jgi:hypothetical protein
MTKYQIDGIHKALNESRDLAHALKAISVTNIVQIPECSELVKL